jgi:hypothetical protein
LFVDIGVDLFSVVCTSAIETVFESAGFPLNDVDYDDILTNAIVVQAPTLTDQKSVSVLRPSSSGQRIKTPKGKKKGEKNIPPDATSVITKGENNTKLNTVPLSDSSVDGFVFPSPFSSLTPKQQASLLQQQTSPLFISSLSSLTSNLLVLKPVPQSSSMDLGYLLAALELLISESKKEREKSVNLTGNQNRSFMGGLQNVNALFGNKTIISNKSGGFIYLTPNGIYTFFFYF